MRSAVLHALLISALIACGDREEKSRAPSPGTVEGLGAIPAEARIVVGANVGRLAESTLLRRTIRRLLGEDPTLLARTDALLETCKLDLAKDLETVHLGVLEDGSSHVLVVRGKLDEPAIIACVKKSVAE